MQDLALAVVRQFLLFAAILTPLELLAPARDLRLRRRGALTDVLHFALNPMLINAGVALVLAGFAVVVRALVPEAARAALGGQPFAVQLVEIVAFGELSGYWLHRLAHRVDWMWRFHSVHHSTEELSWLAAHRQHPLEAVWLSAAANLPVVLLGFSVEPILGFVLFQKLYTAFLHANARVDFGRATILLASPRFHHWHHDRGAQAGNFASLFPFLDRLWGTYRMPAGLPASYGCDDAVPRGWLGQLMWPGHRRTWHVPPPSER